MSKHPTGTVSPDAPALDPASEYLGTEELRGTRRAVLN